MTNAVKKENNIFNYGEYCSWPDDERCELINGIVYDMTPAPSKQHADIAGALFLEIAGFLKGKPCKAYFAPFDVRLPDSDESDNQVRTVVQPNILVVCDEKKLDKKGCRGAPDLIIEILSPATAAKDCIIKRALYEKHGVREFWIIDPANRLVTVYLLNSSGLFNSPQIFDDQAKISVSLFSGLEIDMSAVFPFQPRVVKERPGIYGRTAPDCYEE